MFCIFSVSFYCTQLQQIFRYRLFSFKLGCLLACCLAVLLSSLFVVDFFLFSYRFGSVTKVLIQDVFLLAGLCERVVISLRYRAGIHFYFVLSKSAETVITNTHVCDRWIWTCSDKTSLHVYNSGTERAVLAIEQQQKKCFSITINCLKFLVFAN